MATTAYVRPPFTYDEYRLLPDDGKRYELIEGDLFVSPAPSPLHQTVSRRLQYALMSQLEERGLAVVYNAPIDVVFEETTAVQPDLVVLGEAKRSLVTARAIEGVPDVIVEILSPFSVDRDVHIKRKLYERFAVPEYWVVDPQHGFVEVHRFEAGRYGIRARYDRSGTLTCPEFPDLRVPLEPIFRTP